jgi:hypothetical protein
VGVGTRVGDGAKVVGEFTAGTMDGVSDGSIVIDDPLHPIEFMVIKKTKTICNFRIYKLIMLKLSRVNVLTNHTYRVKLIN